MPGVIFMMKTQDHTNRMKKNGALAHTISLHLCKLSNLKSQVHREYDKHLIFNGDGIKGAVCVHIHQVSTKFTGNGSPKCLQD